MNIDSVKARLRRFEGAIPHMYKCTGDRVTIGIGHAMDDASEACTLHWTAGGAPAGAETVKADFAAVNAAVKGQSAKSYERLTTCRLSQADIDRLMENDIPRYVDEARKVVPDFDQLPGPAQEALFDMAFNLGGGGLRKFKKLLAAVAARDWATAAEESRRLGIQDERNEETKRLFFQAGSVGARA